MSQIRLPFVPGPVRVPAEVLAAREHDFRSADLEPEFIELYSRVQGQLSTIMGTANRPAIMLGEGMIAAAGIDWKGYLRLLGQRPSVQRVNADRKRDNSGA